MELHELYSSPNIIRMNKSGSTRWARYLTCMGETRTEYRVLVEHLRKNHYEDLGIDNMIILKRTSRKQDFRVDWIHQ
jgi:hypothetical protein